MIRRLHLTVLSALAVAGLACLPAQEKAASPKPLRALLIAGGCCHDYAKQQEILSKGIQSRANVQVDVIWSDEKGTAPNFPHYQKDDWAAGYDVIIHDECAADVKDKAIVQRILDTHKTIPAINLHCAMHSFRTGTDVWFKYLGLQSTGHGPQLPIDLRFVDKEHPITKPLADWTTIKEELYNNVNIFDAHPLAMGKQIVNGKEVEYVVAWTNEKAGARTFSTTIGHNNETVADARYLDLITRGLLWACNKLDAEHLVPFTGQNTVTFIKAEPKPAAPKPAAATPAAPAVAPKDATLVTVTASSEEGGKQNYAWKAVDGDRETRWCASSPEKPQSLTLAFDKPQDLDAIKIVWEGNASAYQYKVEVENELGKARDIVVDSAKDKASAEGEHAFKAQKVKSVIITCTGNSQNGWASIREVSLKGAGIKALAAKGAAAAVKPAAAAAAKASDEYKDGGNSVPIITKLTPEQEAEIMKDVKVPEGFEATVFASSSGANYPVYVAAAPNGDLYVSSDGNGSLGRKPKRGRIIRLRDTNNDGRADETKVFCEVDSPRGLVWDHDRLYVVHPPDVSAFIDKDGDGTSDEQQTLVKGIAFGFKDRPADHTTNGLSLGIDGWLYIAGGDFGFMDAVGTDGKHVQHRAGGVIRFRPDGSNLEIYSTGTRNILEVAISPTMDIFARDNTNDGGGWNVRFHHFTGMDNHGYPRLYKNFADEAIAPLADYGGGSGCGAVYIDEPGFGKWNNAPFTADWGTGAIWHQSVAPKGSTYVESAPPEPFIKMTRPTDADVDAMSRVYASSWKGATFDWVGPDVGYIVCVKPKAFTPEPLPNFAKAGDAELVKLLESPSYRRRVEAQRELVRRKASPKSNAAGLAAIFRNEKLSAASRIAAIYTMRQIAQDKADFNVSLPAPATEQDWQVAANALRASHTQDGSTFGTVDLGSAKEGSVYADPRISVQQAQTLAHLTDNIPSDPASIARFINSKQDEVSRLVAIRALGQSQAGNALFGVLDNPSASGVDDTARTSALRALAMIHTDKVVDGLIARLEKTTDTTLRRGLISALARLHFTEGEWKGDSWGTRPDTRGPYYQPEAWSKTPMIAEALKAALAKASPDEAAYMVSELNRNRIQFNEALQRILILARDDASVLPDAVSQLATTETIPAEGIPLLIKAVQTPPPAAGAPAAESARTATLLSNAIVALTKTDSAAGCTASLSGLVSLSKVPGAGKEQEAARTAFLGSPSLENHHQLLEVEAEKLGTPTATWADMALLNLSARKTGSPESAELSRKALDNGWKDVKRRAQILKAVALLKHSPYADKVLASLDDADKSVAAAAQNAAKAMKLEKKTAASGPLISTMKPEDVIAQVIKTKGDVELGEQLFTRQTCVACHTTKETEAQKGPYLGNIAQTYKRPELAQNIIDPNKTIAQGFATEVFYLKDGNAQMGFITLEGADSVKIRTITAQEFTFATKDISKREKMPISMMPPGLVGNLTVKEFASLLDYLESLVKH